MQREKRLWVINTCLYALVLLLIFNFITGIAAAQTPILRRGMQNENVWELQQLLSDLGYKVNVDGYFGSQTEIIVRAFQSSFGLTDDGVVGEKTWNMLRQVNPLLTYVVQRGDNLTILARKFDTSVKAIKLANNMESDLIFAGQELLIPRSWMGGGNQDGLLHYYYYQVERGDTLTKISRMFGVSVTEIRMENGLTGDRIYVGQQLTIPRDIPSATQGVQKGELVWPAYGRISSPFGSRIHPIYGTPQHHSGVDIVLRMRTPVRAAAAGIVTVSSSQGGYGRTIVINHGDGYSTLYAHNDVLLVRLGAYVLPGQVIALSGNTGLSTGPHLHFEIRRDETPVNPLLYLPPRR